MVLLIYLLGVMVIEFSQQVCLISKALGRFPLGGLYLFKVIALYFASLGDDGGILFAESGVSNLTGHKGVQRHIMLILFILLMIIKIIIPITS